MSLIQALLIGGTVVLTISSVGFFFAQFSRSKKNAHRAARSSGLLFLVGVAAITAAVVAAPIDREASGSALELIGLRH